MIRKKTTVVKDLIEIKDEIRGSLPKFYFGDRILYQQLQKINQNIDDIKSSMQKKSSSVLFKRKKEIIDILVKQKKIDSTELAKMVNISRTRCNEYLKEMEREGITKSSTVDKKRYYELAVV